MEKIVRYLMLSHIPAEKKGRAKEAYYNPHAFVMAKNEMSLLLLQSAVHFVQTSIDINYTQCRQTPTFIILAEMSQSVVPKAKCFCLLIGQ